MEATKKKTSNDKVRDAVVNSLLEKIESDNVLPWQKPWQGFEQKNARGTVYRGINQIITSMASAAYGFDSPYWATMKQISKMGGKVKKGSKATLVTFFKIKEVKKEKENENGEKEEETKKFPILRYYKVFNLSQTEGIDMERFTEQVNNENEEVEDAEDLISRYPDPPKVERKKSGSAYYSPNVDTVVVPELKQFENENEFYATLFHELTHSTGAEKRLNRSSIKNRDKGSYSFEEMIAEIGANMLLSKCGMQRSEDREKMSADYVKHWMRKIKEDPKLLFTASSEAQKAVDLISGKQKEEGK